MHRSVAMKMNFFPLFFNIFTHCNALLPKYVCIDTSDLMTRTKVGFKHFHVPHKIKRLFKKNKGPKYDISTTVRCPLCDEEVQVGTAGPQGLNQHQGKKKCRANMEKKRQEEKKVKTLTLFSFMQHQDKREPTEAEVIRESERQEAASSSRIVVGPPATIPLSDMCGKPSGDKIPRRGKERKGCQEAWLLLDQLHTAIGNIPCNVSEGKLGDELAGYNRSAALTACAEIPIDELWENVNPGLDRMLGFGRPMDEIQAIIRRGSLGVEGLFEFLEVLVEEGGVGGGLIEGKVSTLINAINE